MGHSRLPLEAIWICAALLATSATAAEKLLPWQRWVESPIPERSRALPDLVKEPWLSTGGKEGTLTLSADHGPWGGKYHQFHIKVDHFNEGKYPQGWPAIGLKPRAPCDYSGYDCIRFWIRARSDLNRTMPIRFILHTDGKGVINKPLPPFRPGKWLQASFPLQGLPNMDKVTLIHLFICENEYAHGDEMTFDAGGFELCNMTKVLSKLPAAEAAAGLWVGKRADTSDEMVMLEPMETTLPSLLVVETGEAAELRADDTIHFKLRECFTSQDVVMDVPLGRTVAPGTVSRLNLVLDMAMPRRPAGYYLVVADIRRKGKSLLGGRVGSDDLYVRKLGETMTFSVLSVRSGMALWVRDLLYGDLMCRTRIALPHTYDPLDKSTYAEFIRAFGLATGKHTEGNEAGDTGLVLAAEAFRKSGDEDRARFVESLLEDSFTHMIEKMQSPSGATLTWTNELADEGLGIGGGSFRFGSYDSNQIGEWIRPLAYGIVYYHTIKKDAALAAKLNRACRRAADYLVQHSTQASDGIPGVIRHLTLAEKADGTVAQTTYQQEGRQCDVYLGRALSGLSYYAYAMQVLGDEVPAEYWRAMDATVAWSLRKMKPDTGWFDWQCEDVVEGGCHTFLGNIYIGEGLFGCYLADMLAGRKAQAAEAAQATHLAYRYVTDHCVIRGRKFEYPLEFWVGPYVYWLFTEYVDAIGPDPRLQDWLTTLDTRWSVERNWHDFHNRTKGGVSRTSTNGMLELSILGYLGIKQMREIGQPFRLHSGRK